MRACFGILAFIKLVTHCFLCHKYREPQIRKQLMAVVTFQCDTKYGISFHRQVGIAYYVTIVANMGAFHQFQCK